MKTPIRRSPLGALSLVSLVSLGGAACSPQGAGESADAGMDDSVCCDRARWLMSSRTNSSMPITGLRGIRRRGRCPSAPATGSAQGAMPTARRA